MTLNLAESMRSILQRAGYEMIKTLVYARTDELGKMADAYLHHQLHYQKNEAFWPHLACVVEDALVQSSVLEAAAAASSVAMEAVVLDEAAVGADGAHVAAMGGATAAAAVAEVGVGLAQAAALSIGENIGRVLIVNAGAGYAYARAELSSHFAFDQIYGVDDLNVEHYREAHRNWHLEAAWKKVPEGSYFYSGTENLKEVYEKMDEQGGVGVTLIVLVEACHNLAGFSGRAASIACVGRPGDVIVSVQRDGNGVDNYPLLQAEAFLETGF